VPVFVRCGTSRFQCFSWILRDNLGTNGSESIFSGAPCPMATITPRKNREGQVISYQVKIRRLGFPAQSKTFETRTDAKRWAADMGIGNRTQDPQFAVRRRRLGYLHHQFTADMARLFGIGQILFPQPVDKPLILNQDQGLFASGPHAPDRAGQLQHSYQAMAKVGYGTVVLSSPRPSSRLSRIAALRMARGTVDSRSGSKPCCCSEVLR
jgi:hypothetical protein